VLSIVVYVLLNTEGNRTLVWYSGYPMNENKEKAVKYISLWCWH